MNAANVLEEFVNYLKTSLMAGKNIRSNGPGSAKVRAHLVEERKLNSEEKRLDKQRWERESYQI